MPSPKLKTHGASHFARTLRASLLLVLFVLSACESIQQRQPLTPEQQKRYLPFLKHWDAQGKIALSYGAERSNAQFKWQQRDDRFRIILSGPMGIGLTKLTRDDDGVRLENNDIGVKKADSPEELMQALFGWQVPVSNLQYWMLGLSAPNPTPASTQFDESGWPTRLQQDGWLIRYSKPTAHNGWILPGKIVATRDDIKIIAVTKDWKTHKAPRN